MDTILLASSSPRRREILESYGFPLLVRPMETDESIHDNLPVRLRVVALAKDKADAAYTSSGKNDPRWILAADTLVAVRGRVLGKPSSRDQAYEFLELLSGKSHTVATGLALIDRLSGKYWKAEETTKVRFAKLSVSEIHGYLDTNEWQGVAGAYRVQERAAFLIERLTGSYSCVVGLPLRAFYVILRKSGYQIRQPPE